MNRFQKQFLVIALISALLLLSGCSSNTEESPSTPPVTEETSAPIYSDNVPMEYLIMANQSDTLLQYHQSLDIQIEHVLYEDTETWFDGSNWFQAGKDSKKYLFSEDLHWSVVDDDVNRYVQYSMDEDTDGIFLHDSFHLIESNGESEAIVSEAEYEGAFHVITQRPIGEELDYYSMLDATENDLLQEEYVLDSATLSLLINETTLLHTDGSEEKIGTMTITYDSEMPEGAADLKEFLQRSRSGSSQSTVTITSGSQDDIFSITEGTDLKVLPPEGKKLFTDKKKKEAYRGPIEITEDITLYLSE